MRSRDPPPQARRFRRRAPLRKTGSKGTINVCAVITAEKARAKYIGVAERSFPAFMALRPHVLGAAFGSYFAAVFLLAWSFSKDLTGPWYGSDLSRWLYATYFLGSAALLAGVLVVASRRTASIDRRLAQLTDGMRLAMDHVGHENGPDGASART